MITNFDRYEDVELWCLLDLDDGVIGYFKTEQAVLNYIKRNKLTNVEYYTEQF